MCSAEYLGLTLTGMPVLRRHVDHDLVDTLGVHVDLDRTAGSGDGVKERLPEVVAAFRNAAFAVDAQGEAGDLRAQP